MDEEAGDKDDEEAAATEEQPAKEEPAKEEPGKEEPTKEEPAKEEPAAEEAAKERAPEGEGEAGGDEGAEEKPEEGEEPAEKKEVKEEGEEAAEGAEGEPGEEDEGGEKKKKEKKDKDKDKEGAKEGEEDVDERLDFILNYLTKTMRLKTDKWNKMITIEDFKKVIINFFEKPQNTMLLMTLTPAGLLMPVTNFQSNLRNKFSYFIKKEPVVVTMENFREVVIFGDMGYKPVEELIVLAEEVYTPLITNKYNTKSWPDVVFEDVKSQVQAFNNALYQIKGALQGITLLPMPPNIEDIFSALERFEDGDIYQSDLALKSSAEAAVIKWSNMIQDILKETSLVAFEGGGSPGPMREVNFWNGRLANLECIYDQLRDPRVKKLILYIELSHSTYLNCFKNTFKSVVGGIIEARDVSLYLKPLVPYFEKFEEMDFLDMADVIKPMMHAIGMMWARSKYYCLSGRIVVLMQEIGNMFEEAINRQLDPSSIFQGDVEDVNKKITECISVMDKFTWSFEKVRGNLGEYFEEGNPPVPWTFHPRNVFQRMYDFKDRLKIVQSLLGTAIEFYKLEKIEIGGIKGRGLSQKIEELFEEFNTVYANFQNIQYEVLDLSDNNILDDQKKFMAKCIDFDERLAAIFSQAFDDCHSIESTCKLIIIIGNLIDRPIISEQLYLKFANLIPLLADELDLIKLTYDEGNKLGIPLNLNFPPVAGKLWWFYKLRMRTFNQGEFFKNVDHPTLLTEEAEYLLDKYYQMLAILDAAEKEAFDIWAKEIPAIIKRNLAKFQLIRREDGLLELNFDDELAAALKEVRYMYLLGITSFPPEAEALYARNEELVLTVQNLIRTVEWYNHLKTTSLPVEYNMFEDEMTEIDVMLEQAITKLTWETNNYDILNEMHVRLENLYNRVSRAQKNIREVLASIDEWAGDPLFNRKNKDPVELLDLENRSDLLKKRYEQIIISSYNLQVALRENYRLYFNIPLIEPEHIEEEEEEYHEDEDIMGNVSGMALPEDRISIPPPPLPDEDDIDDPMYPEALHNPKWMEYLDYLDRLIFEKMLISVDTSLDFFCVEMDETKKHSPLYRVVVELHEPNIVTIPSIDMDDRDNMIDFGNGLVADVIRMCNHMTRVNGDYGNNYLRDVATYDEIEQSKADIAANIIGAVEAIDKFLEKFDDYEYLWLDSRTEFLRQFLLYSRQLTPEEVLALKDENGPGIKESPPTTAQFRDKIDDYDKLYKEIEKIDKEVVINGWVILDLRPLRQSMLNTVCKWSNMLKQHLVDHVINSIEELENFIIESIAIMQMPLEENDYDGLLKVMGALFRVRERQPTTDNMFEPLKEIMDLLKNYGMEFDEEIYVRLQELPEKWTNCKKIAITTKQAIAPMQAMQVNSIKKRISLFEIRQNIYREKFRSMDIFMFNCKDIYKKLDKIHKELTALEEDRDQLVEQGNLFELQIPEFRALKVVRKEVKQLKQLWDYVNVCMSWIEKWKYTRWKEIDVEAMEMECKKFGKEMRAMDKDYRAWDVFNKMEATVKNMLTSLRAVTELQNPAIRDRHWKQLMQATKVKFVMDENTTLSDLLALNLHEYEDEVKNIVDKSVKEMAMEKVLKELNATWSVMEFTSELHERTNLKLLEASEELIETLEEHQVALQNMMTSKFIDYFYDEVSDWQKKLSNADQVIQAFFEVQRKWCYLESIFIGSEDIRHQLPEDSKRFDYIDREFKDILKSMQADPNVIKATNKAGVFERLDALLDDLTLCEKALNDYLETKRIAFPRFYFVSSADLLDILSNGNTPELVQRHLTKLFDSLAKLIFEGGKGSKSAKGMISKENDEHVDFAMICDCSGKVEIWLNRVIEVMRKTLHKLFSEAVISYEFKAREYWIFDYPAQPALVVTQIWWTIEVTHAFAKLEEGYENSMKDYNKKQIQQLNALIQWLLGDLSVGDRQKIMTICTIDVHSRDVVGKIIAAKVENSQAFQWQSQLRHRWDVKNKDCYVNICDAQFRYQYEYLGNTPRLVITPLTDRCYITLTQSLHLIMGGAPAGPAGTGKTETTKDLGRALGMMVYVFNCSEQMDYKSIGNIYKGLAQTGCWGCFDEFNRISVEVLSVVAVQVKIIQDALKDKKTKFNFLGEEIVLVNTVGLFITMNPGYAGRTELPENLKALFRPCAMVVPDFELISEIMLVAEGFQDARLLARKFITLYTLCRELLSKQDHYDWGLRAIKSVLVVAGALKRGDRQRPEDQVLMRALRDFNIPKIVTDDVPVFMGLIGDLFPALDVPRKRNVEFEKMIKRSAMDLKLQPEDGFVLKVVQLEELFAVRHSVFIVGFTGTGKSMVWKTLQKTYANMKLKPMYNDLNPKAVTNDELFGVINPATREWRDGLFSVIMRDQANLSGDGPKWIVLDGDIDPMWIESLNTLMDDNKVLTLASNERIALTKAMRLLFEIANLRTATPATVSRAGILYINPQDLGWNPYVTSWIDTRSSQSEKASLMLLIDKYVQPCLDVLKARLKKITPICEIAHISMLCQLLECFITPQNLPSECPKDWLEIYFCFCVVWAFGSALFQDQIVDWRNEFNKWFQNEFRSVKFPTAGTVFHYYIDDETKKFLPWSDLIEDFELDPDIPLQATLVNTAETTRVRFFMDHLMAHRVPVMLVGPPGCGKTVLVQEKLSQLSENYQVTNVPFNFYTTSEALQKIMEKPLEKKAGRVFAPSGTKLMIYFIDDMNMPEVDKYFTVQPHTLLRQHLDYQHWYDRQKLSLKEIHNIQYVSCMNPTAGSFTIDPRLQRHFCVFAMSFPSLENLYTIYNSILSQHLNGHHTVRYPNSVIKLCSNVVNSALALHTKVAQCFLPTAIKFHYIFNLRDLSNIFQGILFTTGEIINNQTIFIRLWMHESRRVYADKLTERKDIDAFNKLIYDTLKKGFEDYNETDVMEDPLCFCHFAEGIGDPKYSQIRSYDQLRRLLDEALAGYNDLIAAMNLVLFEDAMKHICRISRIMEAPRGNALLVGVGGSGKQSLSRLAAFISSLEVFQIQLKKGYTLNDMKADIAVLYIKAGLKNISSTFLMSDAQVPEEQFLILVNYMLASGEIPDLLADEDVENIINITRGEVKAAGLQDTRENCWRFYIERVKKLIKVVLCFSPVGSTLRIRGRKFPAVVNCTAIDWFHEWPHQALLNVSRRFLAEIEVLPREYIDSVSNFMSYVHEIVNEQSAVYLLSDKRYNYTTPKSFLEQIALYSKLLTEKTKELKHNIKRLENGLLKLASTSEEVDGLKETLKVQEVEVTKKNDAADKLIKKLGAENEKVAKEQLVACEEEAKVKVIEEDVSVKAKVCAEDLSKAEPALIAAQKALNTLNKNNLTELKSFGSPPQAVVNVMSAVLILFSKGKIPKDRSWKAGKVLMGRVDKFLDDLVYYKKENIHANIIPAVQEYMKDKDFDPEKIIKKSTAAAGICAWVINIMKFYDVFLYVQPKRLALKKATDDLNAARTKLEELNNKLNLLEKQLAGLRAEYEEATDAKMKCQAEADATATMIDLANRLVTGLASENVRWRDSVANFKLATVTLPGDVLLVTAFISYVGCFTRKYRNDLLHKYWLPYHKKLDPAIPMTPDLDPLTMLTDDAQIAQWNNEGLPTDRMSSENATILSNSARWPLMIDPQLQGIKWIKNRYGEHLRVIRLNMKNYLDIIERAISHGEIVLLENIGESVDAVLDPVMSRLLVKKGKCMKLGDKEIDYDPRFRLIIQTKLANPHYKPEIQAQTTLINFTVTRDGLEDQLLAEVVKCERPDLEHLKSSLTKQQNDFKITLKNCEDNLLERLSSATGNILGDVALVMNLETTKKAAAEITIKSAEAKITSVKIDEAREQYRPAAERASILYFILNDLNRVNAIYQFSLKAFTVVFKYSLNTAEPAEKIKDRVVNLLDNITFCVFMYTSRGLFERDKLMFLAQMTFQILLNCEEINAEELDVLLRFPVMPNVTSPLEFLTNVSWGGIKAMSQLDDFKNLDKDIEGSHKRWQKIVESECPENEKMPGEWKNKSPLQKLCIMRALRPDRMTYAVRGFIEEKLGSKFITARSVSFEKSFEETSNSTPTFFILSAGVNPLKDVERVGKRLGFTFDRGNFHSVSLGQGQETVAENAMDVAAQEGHWVILQNIHLVSRWLPTLEKKMDQYNEHSHENYRLFMSAESAPDPQSNVLPQGILESAIKITNEPPTGMFANLHKALDNFTQETLEICSKEAEFKAILFSLCYFHAVVAERRKFGAQGWNRNYPFNVGDLTISVNVLYNYLETNSRVPWEDLRYLFGEIMYGGHITDDWDRRLCRFYLLEYMQPLLLEGELYYAPGFPAPPNTDYQGYHRYIDDRLPPESPYLYGLHPNAEIGFLTNTSENLFKTIFEMQPRDAGAAAGGAQSREEKVKSTLDDVFDKLPDEFNIHEMMAKVEERTPFIIVCFQECERMNNLTLEIKRSLKELDLGMKGELTITPDMEALENSLFMDQVPATWAQRAYPSLLPLGQWCGDLSLRIRELELWVNDFQMPTAVWLGGFFNPQSFLTAIMQQTARKNEWPLDKMCLLTDVTKKQNKDDFITPPREGANIHGLYMEGARWDIQTGSIADSILKELYPVMPVIYVKAITQDKQDLRNMYDCPVYKTKMRGPTFVWTFNLKTKERAAKWVLAGVAILLQI